MNTYGAIILLFVVILAIWKLHDIFFGKNIIAKAKKDAILAEERRKRTVQFFAEFTNKLIHRLPDYEDAPDEIYNQLDAAYREWLEKKSK